MACSKRLQNTPEMVFSAHEIQYSPTGPGRLPDPPIKPKPFGSAGFRVIRCARQAHACR
jgi:hypothetical protein